MSFSKSLSGTAAACAAALLAFPDEQRLTDKYCSAGAIEGHQKQIAAITEAVMPVLEVLEGGPESVSVSGNVWGHANDDGSGNYGFKLELSSSAVTAAVAAQT